MIVKTRVFEICNGKYRNLSELARAMDISVSQVYRVRKGKRNINQKFIIGAMKALPGHKFDDLFYFSSEALITASSYLADSTKRPRARRNGQAYRRY